MLEATLPNRVIELVVQRYLGTHRTQVINERSIPEDKKIFVCLIRFLLNLDFSQNTMLKYSNGKFIVAICEFQQMMKAFKYQEATKKIEKILERYYVTPLIYKNLRKCYLETKEYEKLDRLNHRVSDSYLKYFGRYGKNEGKILRLIEQYEALIDEGRSEAEKEKNEVMSQKSDGSASLRRDSLKLDLLSKIFSLSSSENDYVYTYFDLLKSSSQLEKGLKFIAEFWPKSNSIRLANVYYDFLASKEPLDRYRIVMSIQPKGLLPINYLSCKVAMDADMIDESMEYAKALFVANEALGNAMMILIYRKTNDLEKINQCIDKIADGAYV